MVWELEIWQLLRNCFLQGTIDIHFLLNCLLLDITGIPQVELNGIKTVWESLLYASP